MLAILQHGSRSEGVRFSTAAVDTSHASHFALAPVSHMYRYFYYSKNGNILSLSRNGLTGFSTVNGNELRPGYGLVDQLTYSYEGGGSNRLSKVEDTAPNTLGFAQDFRNGINQVTEYIYDAVNGRCITSISAYIRTQSAPFF